MHASGQAATVRAAVHARAADLLALVEQMAAIESPTGDPAAQEPMLALLERRLHGLGMRTERLPADDGCHHLAAVPDDDAGGAPQLLLGHLDTVWPVGTLESMPVARQGDRLHGPGVFDMKAGIAQMLIALEVLRDLGMRPACPPHVLLNCDEEIGSPSSRHLIEDRAAAADRVLVMEPAYGPHGALKTGRKGIGNFDVIVGGVASHAGLAPEAGVSAILELSRQVERLFALNDASRGITVNVGTIDGGIRPNVVAAEARAEVEARVLTMDDAAEVERAIRALAPTMEGTTVRVEGRFRRPPMERTPGNARLFGMASAAAAQLGIALDEAQVGGGSDANFTSPLAPTLDGLGAVGDGAHADHEHAVIPALPERTALLALMLLAPSMEDGP